MFLPQNDAAQADMRAAEKARREGYSRIEVWVTKAIPAEARKGVTVSVQEVVCNDPECAPVDTAVVILFASGGKGMLGIPAESKDVTQELLFDNFPTNEVLLKWSRGEDAEWPPFDDDELDMQQSRPPLRFEVGTRVVCRVGPDPVTGWSPGLVTQLWYREPSWPADSWAPYKVELQDRRSIFAPGDVDQIIRAME